MFCSVINIGEYNNSSVNCGFISVCFCGNKFLLCIYHSNPSQQTISVPVWDEVWISFVGFYHALVLFSVEADHTEDSRISSKVHLKVSVEFRLA